MRAYIYIFILLYVFSGQEVLKAQHQTKIDSLNKLLAGKKQDTSYIKNVILLGEEYKYSNPDKAIQFGKLALDLSGKLKFKTGEGKSLNMIGVANCIKGHYAEGRKNFEKYLLLFKNDTDSHNYGTALNNIATSWYYEGKLSEALNSYFRSMKVMENINDSAGMANAYGNLGNVYKDMNRNKEALDYYNKSLHINEAMHDMIGAGKNLSNLSLIFLATKDYDKAKELLNKALLYQSKSGDLYGYSVSLLDLAGIYDVQKDYKNAMIISERARKILLEMGDSARLAQAYEMLGMAKFHNKQYKEAEQDLLASIDIARKTSIKLVELESLRGIAELYAQTNRPDKAYKYAMLFASEKDSVFTKQNSEQMAEMQTKYESEKKEKEIQLLNKNKALQESELSKQKTFRNSLMGIVALVVALALVLFMAFRNKQQSNKVLEKQKTEIEEKNEELNQQNEEIAAQRDQIENQKHLVEEKNKEITDSIHYARRIQKALLTSESYFAKHLPEFFILYQPKDIVSGDFYWGAAVNGQILMATADCTGHGVPGAFMSMLGVNLLNEIIIERGITQPDIVLNQLRVDIIKALNPTDTEDTISEELKDGMDVVLTNIDITNKKLRFAAANNPLWIIREDKGHPEVLEFKADKFPVGKYGEEQKPFTLREISLQKNDLVYTFSDGFADQFGGISGKKFKQRQLQDLLLSIYDKPLSNQKKILSDVFNYWKGNYEQVDDILIIGIKV